MPAKTEMPTSSNAIRAIRCTRGKPSARKVRMTGRRCSNARPMAPCTMKIPTINERRPKAVRFKWKLSVKRPTSDPLCGGINSKFGAITSSGGCMSGCCGATIRREICPSNPNSICAVPTSVRITAGATSDDGNLRTSTSPNRSRVSWVANKIPRVIISIVNLPSLRPTGASPLGDVRASMPIKRMPSNRPSTTGLTSQPARRKAMKSSCGIVPVRATIWANIPSPKVSAAASYEARASVLTA